MEEDDNQDRDGDGDDGGGGVGDCGCGGEGQFTGALPSPRMKLFHVMGMELAGVVVYGSAGPYLVCSQ